MTVRWVKAPGDKSLCRGCRDDYYNQPGNSTTGECWRLKSEGYAVTRYKLGWWTRPDEAGAFEKVTVYPCYHQPGQFAYYEKLPDFAKDVR